jgi:hypothetical protein
MCREARLRRLRSLTSEEALAWLDELYSFAQSLPRERTPGQERLERLRWEEKVALRKKMAAVFAEFDQVNDARSSPDNDC